MFVLLKKNPYKFSQYQVSSGIRMCYPSYLPKIFLQRLNYYFFEKTEGSDISKENMLFSQIFMKTAVSRGNWKTNFTNSFGFSRFSLGPYK